MTALLRKFVLVFVAFTLAAGELVAAKVAVIKSREELERYFYDMAMSLENRGRIKLGGFLEVSDLNQEANKTSCFDYISRWEYNGKPDGTAVMKFEYHDSTRMLAAFFEPELQRKLSAIERRALEIFKKRVEKLKVKGMPRQGLVQAILDDNRLRIRLQTHRKKASCAQGILKNGMSEEECALYVFMMLSAHEIPCRVVRIWNQYWNMVQMEDGKWYHVAEHSFNISRALRPELNQADSGGYFYVNNMLQPDVPVAEYYPATPEVNIQPLPEYKTLKSFWRAAEKAYQAGKIGMGAILRKYPGKEEFEEAMAAFLVSGHTVDVAAMYVPGIAAENVYVYLNFQYESSQGEASEDDEESLIDKGNKAIQKFKSLLDDAA